MSPTRFGFGGFDRDPLAMHVRQRYFVEIFFCGYRIDGPVVMSLAIASDDDLTEAVKEAALANVRDEVKALFRYSIRIYEYREHKGRPRKGGRIMDFVPRGEEGELNGVGHAA